MKAQIKITQMRTLLFILLFVTVTGFAYAQPPINQPNDLSSCDSNDDGSEIFDLTVNNSLILGSLNPSLYEITFHQTNEDAINDLNPISQPNSYQSNEEVVAIHVRVEEIADTTNFGIANFNLFVNPLPVIDLNDLTTCSNSNDSLICNVTPNGNYIYTWSLNGNVISGASLNTYYPTTSGLYEVNVLNSITGCSASDSAQVIVNTTPTATISGGGNYFINSNSASFVISIQNGVNPYTVNYTVNGNPSQITSTGSIISVIIPTDIVTSFNISSISLSDGNGCIVTLTDSTSFNIIPNINSPTPYLICEDNSDGFSDFDLQIKNIEILGILSPINFSVTYYINMQDAQNGINQIPLELFQNTTAFSQTVYVRVQENTNTQNYSTSAFDLLVNNNPIANQTTYLAVEDIPFDGIGTFDLSTKSIEILGNQTNCSVTFYTGSYDNIITNPESFSNEYNPQAIYAKVTNNTTGCYSYTEFNVVLTNPDIVTIPDISFKNMLIYLGVDTNSDGEIQFSEASSITNLDVTNQQGLIITDMTGIETFTNLLYLRCSNQNLSELNINSLINLKYLGCANNQLNTLEVYNLINLEVLYISENKLTSIDLSNLINLKELYCDNNQLSSLNISNLTQLTFLSCSYNQISVLNVNTLLDLENLFCENNQISELNVTALSNLVYFSCSENQLTTIDVSNNTSLYGFDCYSNQLTSIDVSNLLNLHGLDCYNNQITSIDVSQNINLEYLSCFNNPPLQTLFLKNGKNENLSLFNTFPSPNLLYICADEDQIALIQQEVGSNVTVNSYCSFNPGGNYNTISGNIKLDANNNGCDANDLAQPNIRVNINDGINTGASFTSTTGDYKFYTQAGSFVITPEIENPTFFNFTPTIAPIPFADNNNNLATQDFCISANGVHPDLEVVLAPIAPARPGFDATYKLVYKNKGNQTLSGSVNLVFDDTKTDFISANPAVDNLAVNSLTWNYNTLLPFESRSIDIVLNVNSPLETPAVNIGDVLTLNATITPLATDEIPADNSFTYNQTVVGAFDPNNIICVEGTSVSPSTIGDYLHYAINFENTGNFPAENIVVKTTIDPTKFDINSLQLLNTSNPVEARITGNVVEFIFKTIHLATGGHGHILLKMRSNANLVSGDSVSKRADIFFDYNAPIDTGLVNTVFETLSNSIVTFDNSVNVYPNPTKNYVNINCNSTIKTIELFDIQGRLLTTKIVDDSQSNLDISTYSNGIYFVKITTEKGSKVEKVIKE